MMMQEKNPARKALRRKLNFYRIIGNSLGCGGGIGIIVFLAAVTNTSAIIPSFGATCVIAIVTMNSAFAQPRSIIGGHFLCSMIGLLCVEVMGATGISLTIAVAISTMVMQLTRTMHPPAASDPIFFMMHDGMTWPLLFFPVLTGSLILVAYFFFFHKWADKKRYPAYWY